MKYLEKFTGKVNYLDKEEVFDLLGVITDLKPTLNQIDNSKLLDNLTYYLSEDRNYKISVYFRESNEYRNNDNSITYGDYNSLFKIKISKNAEFNSDEVKDFVNSLSNVINDIFKENVIIIKLNDRKLNIEEFNYEGNTVINDFKINIKL
jgi:hypothetical protein